MANGFGALYVGSSGLRGAQNGLNVIANNISNVETKGYVREQTLYVDVDYNYFANASVSDQRVGLGVDVGDVVHTRDRFLDTAYRQEAGRCAFYDANYEACMEVETLLQEGDGESFSLAIADLYEAFNEFAKDPNAGEIQNLLAQKASLFIARAKSVNTGMTRYQDNINAKIRDDIDKINELGKTISQLNYVVQKIEAGNVETAMEARDARDQALDELAQMVNISYDENYNGIVRVQIEGQPFVDVDTSYQIDMYLNKATGFYEPYWSHLTDPNSNSRYPVFNLDNISTTSRGDIGEVKALLLARGNKNANYTDIENLTSAQYEAGISNSVMMNSEAELDSMVHAMVTQVNEFFAPTTEFSKLSSNYADYLQSGSMTVIGEDGKGYTLTADSKILVLDEDNCCVGRDGELPPHELFSRQGVERFNKAEIIGPNDERTGKYVYIYNEENPNDPGSLYTLSQLVVNKEVSEHPELIPHRHQPDKDTGMGGAIAYDMAANIYELWEKDGFKLNPSDVTPCSFENFYTKFCGELANSGSIYRTTAESVKATRDQVGNRRQEIIGVNTDEELQNMIRFQNAYNASSRYINVVSQMIEYLLSSV